MRRIKYRVRLPKREKSARLLPLRIGFAGARQFVEADLHIDYPNKSDEN